MNISTDSNINIQHTDTVKRVTWVGLICNLFLSFLKCFLGYMGSSQAVIADGIHSLSDLITDLAILVGVKYWTAPADEKHPYGHHRYETLVSSFIGIVLAVAAIGLAYKALVSFKDNSCSVQPTWVAIVAAVLSIILKELLYRWTFRTGEKIKSTALMANAYHHRSDALSSIPVLFAVVVSIINPAWSFVDHIGAIIVSVFILKTAYEIIRDSLSSLIDTSASKGDRSEIERLVLEVDGVISTHKIRTRKIGYGLFVDLHIQVDGSITVIEGHHISRSVKEKLHDYGPDVIDLIVHIEPYEVEGT